MYQLRGKYSGQHWLVVKQGMTLTVIGVAIGPLASFAFTRFMCNSHGAIRKDMRSIIGASGLTLIL